MSSTICYKYTFVECLQIRWILNISQQKPREFNDMSKRSVKSPCVWFKFLMLLQFFGERKTRFAHAITANKRTASHNFRTYIWICLHWLSLSPRSEQTFFPYLWSVIVFEENVVMIVMFQRLLGSPLNLTLSLRK